MIQEFEITRPAGTYGDSIGKYFDAAYKRFSTIGLMVGSVTFDAEKGVTFDKVCDPSMKLDIDNVLDKFHGIGLAVDRFIIEENDLKLYGVVDIHDW